MRCNKCGEENPDAARFCTVCGHKLQSDHHPGAESPESSAPETPSTRPLLDFQGWTRPGRGLGPYLEACIYAVILIGAVVWCLADQITWPLYPILAILALVAWLRRL